MTRDGVEARIWRPSWHVENRARDEAAPGVELCDAVPSGGWVSTQVPAGSTQGGRFGIPIFAASRQGLPPAACRPHWLLWHQIEPRWVPPSRTAPGRPSRLQFESPTRDVSLHRPPRLRRVKHVIISVGALSIFASICLDLPVRIPDPISHPAPRHSTSAPFAR